MRLYFSQYGRSRDGQIDNFDAGGQGSAVAKTLTNALLIAASVVVIACASNKPYQIDLMPAPDVYAGGGIDPLPETHPFELIPYSGVLYATDREPAGEDDPEDFYTNARGRVLRLGVAQIELGDGQFSWEEVRQISLLKNRTDEYPLKLEGAEEVGILENTVTDLNPPEILKSGERAGAERFAVMVNEKLQTSQKKDIFIYIHGYKVGFENPILVATELWHFLGYDGVFIAYSWPSTPKRLAYASDAETAVVTSRNLRIFLEYLARESDAERIHLIGYSQGTRVVITALAHLALERANQDAAAVRSELRIGHAIVVGSDYDRDIFVGHLEDGILKVPEDFSIYMSQTDKALGVSRWIFSRERLGQMVEDGKIKPVVADYLRGHHNLHLIDVTDAEGAASGNGHAYFRKSPWASSDILMTIMYDLGPDKRGLVRAPEAPMWTFPPDYIERLAETLNEVNPELGTAIGNVGTTD